MRFPGILLALACIALSACNAHFGPATWGHDPFAAAKPMYQGNDTAWHVTGGRFTLSSGYNDLDRNASFSPYYYRAHTFEHAQVVYGAQGTLGMYHVGSVLPPELAPGSRTYASLGGRFGLYGRKSFEKVDWSYLGVALYYNREFGQFLAFRQNFPIDRQFEDLDFFVAPTPNLFSLAFSTDLTIALDPEKSKQLQLHFAFARSFFDQYELVLNDGNIIDQMHGSILFAGKGFGFRVSVGFLFARDYLSFFTPISLGFFHHFH